MFGRKNKKENFQQKAMQKPTVDKTSQREKFLKSIEYKIPPKSRDNQKAQFKKLSSENNTSTSDYKEERIRERGHQPAQNKSHTRNDGHSR